ncbi:hypothetical protein [Nocardioides flavescens]|uniref:EamA-like transporter family protein n=1 Tax=Nocardioides flavescens TaxID=2691959 RepID=A0A6L7F4V9_9ACTN|nr:hypothetical protein [Nocardioides flavescens]MXG92171.1 hypothetical protein [Nocardioides flavescens]
MSTSAVAGLVAGLVSAAVFGVAAVVQAAAVRDFDTQQPGLAGFVRRSVRDARTMLVVAAYLLGFVLHAVAIWLLPLYLAQALVAMSLPVTALASRRVESALSRRGWTAVALVTGGLVLLSLGAGEPGTIDVDGRFAAAVWGGVLVLGVATVTARRLSGPVLGLVAGLGYAGSAIATRGIALPVDVVVVVVALAVPSLSVLAFYLYSLGMERAAVPATSASLVVAQTFVPSAVGVAFLGDGVRDGWWPAVVAGLLLAMLGASVLGAEVRTDGPAPE